MVHLSGLRRNNENSTQVSYANAISSKVDPNSFNPLIQLFPIAVRSILDNYRNTWDAPCLTWDIDHLACLWLSPRMIQGVRLYLNPNRDKLQEPDTDLSDAR